MAFVYIRPPVVGISLRDLSLLSWTSSDGQIRAHNSRDSQEADGRVGNFCAGVQDPRRADRTYGRICETTAECGHFGPPPHENLELRTGRDILNHGLPREAQAIEFAWIAAEKAFFCISHCVAGPRYSGVHCWHAGGKPGQLWDAAENPL